LFQYAALASYNRNVICPFPRSTDKAKKYYCYS